MKESTKSILKPTFSNDWMERFFNSGFPANWGIRFTDTLPSVNVSETNDAIKIELAAPGLKKDNFKIDLKERQLTISYENREEKKEDEKNYTKREYNYTSFSRSFELPDYADENSIKAGYENGELIVTIAKTQKEETKNARTISIS